MKKSHTKLVSKCKNDVECKFGPIKCWYLHQEDIEITYTSEKNENKT